MRFWVGLTLSLWLDVAPALAQDAAVPAAPVKKELAKQHYEAAVRFFAAGDYDSARVEFEAAFRLNPAADLLYNLSLTAERQGKIEDAIQYLEDYQQMKHEAEDQKLKEDLAPIGQRMERLRRMLQPAERPTPSAPPAAPPPPAQAAPSAALAVVGRDIAPVPDGRRAPRAAIGLVAGGAVLEIIAIGTGAAALNLAQQLDAGPVRYGDLQTVLDRGHALEAAGITLAVLGGAGLVAGSAWLGYWGWQRRVHR